MESLLGRLGQLERDGLGLLFVQGPKSFNITLEMFDGKLSLEQFIGLEGQAVSAELRDGKVERLRLAAAAQP